MKHMTQKLELAIYGYDKDEFLPIYREGRIDNLDEFITYKAKKIGNRVLNSLDRAYYTVAGQ